jgi:hypothetical protein
MTGEQTGPHLNCNSPLFSSPLVPSSWLRPLPSPQDLCHNSCKRLTREGDLGRMDEHLRSLSFWDLLETRSLLGVESTPQLFSSTNEPACSHFSLLFAACCVSAV